MPDIPFSMKKVLILHANYFGIRVENTDLFMNMHIVWKIEAFTPTKQGLAKVQSLCWNKSGQSTEFMFHFINLRTSLVA